MANGGVGQQGGINRRQQVQLPEGVDRLYAIEGDNSLLVFSTVDGFNLVKEIVKNLDIAPRQVEIKVEFVTASVSDVDNFGINFSLIPVPNVQARFTPALDSTAGGSGATTNPNSYLQFTYGNIAGQLYALLQKTRTKLVSAPMISTTNNVPAYINFTQTIPFQTQNTTIVPNGGTVTTTQQNIQYINTFLPVTPRINGDDTVTLDIQPTISAPTGTPANGQPAPTSTQNLQTTRTVRSGETMVIGGLVTKNESYIQSKIPILGDLPIIGSFFRSRTVNNTDQELLIFVTPTIIDEGTTNSGVTSAPQGELGVNGAPGGQPNPGGQVAPESSPSAPSPAAPVARDRGCFCQISRLSGILPLNQTLTKVIRVFRFLTAGEFHGPALTAIIEGVPAGLSVLAAPINAHLKRRQGGYGRGARQKIESDTVEILSGVRFGRALGSPITMVVRNRDWQNWTTKMSVEPLPEGQAETAAIAVPRPGHADYAGMMKYDHDDLRNVLERASARNTATLVAVGAVARQLLG